MFLSLASLSILRCSTVAWLPEHTAELVARLNRRIGRWTNLATDTAEQLQVSNCAALCNMRLSQKDTFLLSQAIVSTRIAFDFLLLTADGIGGHYEPHYDHHGDRSRVGEVGCYVCCSPSVLGQYL